MELELYYTILGIKNDSSLEEIKSAYRKLVIKYHPDRNKDNPEASNQIKMVNQAYDILMKVHGHKVDFEKEEREEAERRKQEEAEKERKEQEERDRQAAKIREEERRREEAERKKRELEAERRKRAAEEAERKIKKRKRTIAIAACALVLPALIWCVYQLAKRHIALFAIGIGLAAVSLIWTMWATGAHYAADRGTGYGILMGIIAGIIGFLLHIIGGGFWNTGWLTDSGAVSYAVCNILLYSGAVILLLGFWALKRNDKV